MNMINAAVDGLGTITGTYLTYYGASSSVYVNVGGKYEVTRNIIGTTSVEKEEITYASGDTFTIPSANLYHVYTFMG